MKALYKKIGVAVVLLLCIVALSATGLFRYLSFDQLKEHQQLLRQLVQRHDRLSVVCFIAIYTLFQACMLPGAAVLTVASGFLFGTIPGTLYTTIGATCGGVCAFLIVRYLVGATIQKRYAQQLAPFNRALHKHGSPYLIGIHFVAFIPFSLVNVLAACTTISLWQFVWTTAVGVIPVSCVYAFAGEQLTYLASARDIFSWHIVGALAILALFAVVPWFMQRVLYKPL